MAIYWTNLLSDWICSFPFLSIRSFTHFPLWFKNDMLNIVFISLLGGQKRVPQSCKVQIKITYISNHNLLKIFNVITTCEFPLYYKLSLDFNKVIKIYKYQHIMRKLYSNLLYFRLFLVDWVRCFIREITQIS